MSAALDVQGLTTRFETRRGVATAINDVSFAVEPGRKSLGSQFQEAQKRGFRIALTINPNEMKLKNLDTRQDRVITRNDIISEVRNALQDSRA